MLFVDSFYCVIYPCNLECFSCDVVYDYGHKRDSPRCGKQKRDQSEFPKDEYDNDTSQSIHNAYEILCKWIGNWGWYLMTWLIRRTSTRKIKEVESLQSFFWYIFAIESSINHWFHNLCMHAEEATPYHTIPHQADSHKLGSTSANICVLICRRFKHVFFLHFDNIITAAHK